MKRISFFLISILITLNVSSQSFKYGNIPDEHWKINNCSFDTSAFAIVLFDVGITTISTKDNVRNFDSNCNLTINHYIITHSRHLRIKIFKKQEDLRFSFLLKSTEEGKELLSSFKALSQINDNKKRTKKKYSKKDLSILNNEKNGNSIYLDLSNEKEGSIIDIFYSVNSSIFKEFPTWSFSNDFPTFYSEISYYYPDFFEINKISPVNYGLKYESSKKEVQYRISFKVQNGWNDKVYSYYQIFEKHSAENTVQSKDIQKSSLMRIEIKNINFAKVARRQETWRK